MLCVLCFNTNTLSLPYTTPHAHRGRSLTTVGVCRVCVYVMQLLNVRLS